MDHELLPSSLRKAPCIRRSILVALLLMVVVGLFSRWQSPSQQLVAMIDEDEVLQDEVFEKIPEAIVQMMIQVEEEVPAEPEQEKGAEPDQSVADPGPKPPIEPAALQASSQMATETEVSRDEIPSPERNNSPDIEGQFEVPVLDYVAAVASLAGGRLIIWDRASGKAIGEVVEETFNPSATLKNFSNRARDLTEDLPAEFRNQVIQQVRNHYHFGIWRFVLVIPESAEQSFKESISEVLRRAGLDWSNVDLLQLRYSLNQGHVIAQIESASTNGSTVVVNQAAQLW